MVNSSDILNASILIVDDEEPNVLLLERTLRGAGYTSIAFTMNPHKVCELYRKNRYDLILLDIQMPGMDGFQVMEGLKEIETDDYLPVLVITAQPGQKLRALQAGAKDFISKPFDLAEVRARLQYAGSAPVANENEELQHSAGKAQPRFTAVSPGASAGNLRCATRHHPGDVKVSGTEPQRFVYFLRNEAAAPQIALGANHEESGKEIHGIKPRKVYVSAIHGDDGIFFQRENIQDIDIVYFAGSQADKRRNGSPQIE